MECAKCNVKMELRKTTFRYLGHEMTHPILRCPVCGQAFIPEELANGKILSVEKVLEDK